jgi:hypothetical protein
VSDQVKRQQKKAEEYSTKQQELEWALNKASHWVDAAKAAEAMAEAEQDNSQGFGVL